MPIDRPRKHGDYYRTSPRRDKNGRLDHRSRPGRRRSWRACNVDWNARRRRKNEKILHGTRVGGGARARSCSRAETYQTSTAVNMLKASQLIDIFVAESLRVKTRFFESNRDGIALTAETLANGFRNGRK